MVKQATSSKERPSYAISSVDHALRLAALLQVEGTTTVSEAAAHLGVAPSTAHRLLAMLVYRDFATRDGRSYRVGPVLAQVDQPPGTAGHLRDAALGPMTRLMNTTGETVTLMILTQRHIRFLAEVECAHHLRVGHRTGMVFPAHRTSGGLAMLAEWDDDAIRALYAQAPEGEELPDFHMLFARLESVRHQGFAMNNGLSERGVLALGHTIQGPEGVAVASLSIAMPASRFEPTSVRGLVSSLRRATREVEVALAETP